VILIFDEVKTGLSAAAGGATERFGVIPDMVTVAKALGGGLPMGGVGMTEEISQVVRSGKVYLPGTFNANPLGMTAARATLDLLTPTAYDHLEGLNQRLMDGCAQVLRAFELPGYTVGIGSKGCVTFTDRPIVDYASFRAAKDHRLTELAWAYNVNRGVYMSPGREEEWTLTITHTDEAVDCFVSTLRDMAQEVTA
jgi:glutamate-1-semialdehyde 2,1-aminomutase